MGAWRFSESSTTSLILGAGMSGGNFAPILSSSFGDVTVTSTLITQTNEVPSVWLLEADIANFPDLNAPTDTYDEKYHQPVYTWTKTGGPAQPSYTYIRSGDKFFDPAQVKKGPKVYVTCWDAGAHDWSVEVSHISRVDETITTLSPVDPNRTVTLTAAVSSVPDTSKVYVNAAGSSSGVPAGATVVTTFDAAIDAIGGGAGHWEVYFNRGETFTTAGQRLETTDPSFTLRDYGSGALPVIDCDLTGSLPSNSFLHMPGNRWASADPTKELKLINLRFTGPWDTSAHTGVVSQSSAVLSVIGGTGAGKHYGMWNCEVDGHGITINAQQMTNQDPSFTVENCSITNWANYGFLVEGIDVNVQGNAIRQSEDALAGPNTFDKPAGDVTGNYHGPWRGNGRTNYFYSNDAVTKNSWFQRVGSSPARNDEQPCFRLMNEGESGDFCYFGFNICEGGFSTIASQRNNNSNTVFDINLIVEGNYLGASHATLQTMRSDYRGITFRNNVITVPLVTKMNGFGDVSNIFVLETDNPSTPANDNAPVEIYHNTFYSEETGTNVSIASGLTLDLEANNLISEPDTTPANDVYGPLTTTKIFDSLHTGDHAMDGGPTTAGTGTDIDFPTLARTPLTSSAQNAAGTRYLTEDKMGITRDATDDIGAYRTADANPPTLDTFVLTALSGGQSDEVDTTTSGDATGYSLQIETLNSGGSIIESVNVGAPGADIPISGFSEISNGAPYLRGTLVGGLNGPSNSIVQATTGLGLNFTAPTLGTLATNVSGTQVTGTFSKNAYGTEIAANWTINGSVPDSVTFNGGTSFTADMTSNPILSTDTPTLDYSGGDITGEDGNALSDISGASVTNNVVGGSFVPSDLGSKLRLWWDFDDQSTIYSDNPPTTQITNGQEILYIEDKSTQDNDGEFDAGAGATYTNGPDWNSGGYAEYAVERLAALSPSGMTTDMVVFVKFRTNDANFVLIGSEFGSVYAGRVADTSSSTTIAQNSGTPTFEADGVAAGTTRDELHTAFSTGTTLVGEIVGVDLTTAPSWDVVLAPMSHADDAFGLGYTGDLFEVVIVTNDLTTQERTDLESYLGI